MIRGYGAGAPFTARFHSRKLVNSPFPLKTGYHSPFYLAEKRVNWTDVRFLGQLYKPPSDRCKFRSH